MSFRDSTMERGNGSFANCSQLIVTLFKADVFALRNIVFDAHPGDLICIIGPVGSGKVCSHLLMTLTHSPSFFLLFRVLSCNHSPVRSPTSMDKSESKARSATCRKKLVSLPNTSRYTGVMSDTCRDLLVQHSTEHSLRQRISP